MTANLVKSVHSDAEFISLLKTDPTKLVVVDFTATWCGPCRTMAPIFAELSAKYRQVIFAKVDVDELQETAQRCGVTAMPTFQFYKNESKIGELKGANPHGLEQLIKQYGETAASSIEGPSSEAGIKGHSDLIEFITMNQLDCLNQKRDHPVQNIFKRDDSYLESDVDEQLMITVPFNQSVKLHSIKLVAPKEFAPKIIKTYVNRVSLGFDEAENVIETQTLELSEKDYEGDSIIPLRFVKYQGVTSIVVFVESNQEDTDTTKVQQLIFYGTPVETTKMADLKKIDDHHH